MKILLIYTGGTIGCVGTPLAPMSGPLFERAFDALILPMIHAEHPDASFDFHSFAPPLDSTNIQPADWCDIALRILDNYAGHDAFLVLHGTDSMAWSAAALSFLLTGLRQDQSALAVLTKPVIVTGSQLPLFSVADFSAVDDGASHASAQKFQLLFNTDALQNVCGAVASIAAAIAAGRAEVGLYFDNKLMRGNRTLKTDANQFDAFSSPNYALLGLRGISFKLATQNMLPPCLNLALALDVQWPAVKTQVARIRERIGGIGVMAFPAFPAWINGVNGSDAPGGSLIANLLRACLDQGISGLILQSYGADNFPSGNPARPQQGAVYQVLKAANAKGVVMVDATQVVAGTVNGSAYAAGSWMSECGIIGSFDMASGTALTKLIYLQALNLACDFQWGQAAIKQLFMRSLAGELMEPD